jgi:hypothetical protein
MLVGYNIESVQIYFHNLWKLQNNIFIFLKMKGSLVLGRQKHFQKLQGLCLEQKKENAPYLKHMMNEVPDIL